MCDIDENNIKQIRGINRNTSIKLNNIKQQFFAFG